MPRPPHAPKRVAVILRILVAAAWAGLTGCAGDGAPGTDEPGNPKPVVVTVTGQGGGSGAIRSADPQMELDCELPGAACSGTLKDAGAAREIQLTATPAAGSIVAGWTGCSSSTRQLCYLTVPEDHEEMHFAVTARFEPAAEVNIVRLTNASDILIHLSGPSEDGALAGRLAPWESREIVVPAAVGGKLRFVASSAVVELGRPGTLTDITCTVTEATWKDGVPATVRFETYWGNHLTCSGGLAAEFGEIRVTVSGSGAGAGRVSANINGVNVSCDFPSNGGCGDTLPKTGGAGQVILLATPSNGSVLEAWTGCSSISGSLCMLDYGAGAGDLEFTVSVRFEHIPPPPPPPPLPAGYDRVTLRNATTRSVFFTAAGRLGRVAAGDSASPGIPSTPEQQVHFAIYARWFRQGEQAAPIATIACTVTEEAWQNGSRPLVVYDDTGLTCSQGLEKS